MKTGAKVIGVALAALAIGAVTHWPATASTPARTAPVSAVVPVSHSVSAPTTAAGYAAMFAAVPTSQWGAADVGISVPLGSRSVWLWGDTLSEGRFVHSTAITQDGSSLHVSHAGAQLLPNDDAAHIYWIQSAKAVSPTTLAITARSVILTGTGAWAFKDGGFSRTALATLDAAGDVTFTRWVSKVNSPAPNPGRMVILGPHHFSYSFQTHPEAHLASGRVLQSAAQNWDDGILHSFADYRPIWSER